MIEGLPAFTLGAAFLAGLAGGAHCAAMCGPLVGIACRARDGASGAQWLRHALAYNAGRIASYAIAGAVTGAVGAGGLALRGEPLTQQLMLAAMSVSLIVLAAYVAGVAPLVRGIEAAGAVGQIIEVVIDDSVRNLVAPSFLELISMFFAQAQAGELDPDDEGEDDESP